MYQIIRIKNEKAVGVFDPDTMMLVKQYSSSAAAGQAAVFLCESLNHDSGTKIEKLQSSHVEAIIRKSCRDPSLLLFGYRWLPVDNLRTGNFVIK